MSLSARRAWIEITRPSDSAVDSASLSARRAWIEIPHSATVTINKSVALRKESVDRNTNIIESSRAANCRSPQGERG